MQGFTSIPFKADSANGLKEFNGIAKFSGAGIVLEFESKLFGLFSNGVKEVRLPLGEVLDLKFRKGLLRRRAKIDIRLRSMARLVELPNNNGKITLKIAAEDFDRASEAATHFQNLLLETPEPLPPAHTPVSVLFDSGEDETEELSKPRP